MRFSGSKKTYKKLIKKALRMESTQLSGKDFKHYFKICRWIRLYQNYRSGRN